MTRNREIGKEKPRNQLVERAGRRNFRLDQFGIQMQGKTLGRETESTAKDTRGNRKSKEMKYQTI